MNCSVNYFNIFFFPSFSETSQPAVYNSIAHPIKGPAFGEGINLALKLTEVIPFNNIIWKPSVIVTKYKAWYYVNVILLHLIPGLLIDGLLKICGKKPQYVNIYCVTYVNISILLIMLCLPPAGIT